LTNNLASIFNQYTQGCRPWNFLKRDRKIHFKGMLSPKYLGVLCNTVLCISRELVAKISWKIFPGEPMKNIIFGNSRMF
jgi:hypothetical protein